MEETRLPGVHFHPLSEAQAGRQGLDDGQRQVLADLERRVGGAADLAEVVALLDRCLAPVSTCERSSLAFLDDDGERLVSKTTRASYQPILLDTGYSEALAGSTLAQVIAGRCVRIIDDLQAYAEARPESRSTRLLLREGIRSSLTCPLIVDDRVVGVLFCSSRDPGRFDGTAAALLVAAAERLAQAVEKAWRIDRLEIANRNYAEMLGFVAHEFKAPVAGLSMDAALIRDGYLGPVSEAQRQRLDGMVRKAGHLLGLVREYLDLARLEGGELRPDIRPGLKLAAEVVAPALDLLASAIEEHHTVVEQEVPEDLSVVGDAGLLRVVATNLIGNAIKYGREGGRIRITGGPRSESVFLRVWNEGPGFAPNSRRLLFRKFSRLNEPELRRRPGTGVGLYTSWRIARLHGGRIEAESEPGNWAAFTLVLPASGGCATAD